MQDSAAEERYMYIFWFISQSSQRQNDVTLCKGTINISCSKLLYCTWHLTELINSVKGSIVRPGAA